MVIMELKLFTDLIAAPARWLAGGLKAIVNLPEVERETMRQTLNETYRVTDTTLNMLITRLGAILLYTVDDSAPGSECRRRRWRAAAG
jgi:hypothetical protein